MAAFDDVNSSDSQVADTSGDRSTDSGAISRGVWDDIASNCASAKNTEKTATGSTPGSLDMSAHDIYASHDSDISPGKSATAVLEKPQDTKPPTDSTVAATGSDTAAGVTGPKANPIDSTAAVTPTDNSVGPKANPSDTAVAAAPTDNGAGAVGAKANPTDSAGAAAPTDNGAGASGPKAPADNQAGSSPTAPTDNQAGAPPGQPGSPSFLEHPLDWTANKAQGAEQWTENKVHGAEQTVKDAWHKVTGNDTPQDTSKEQPAKPADAPADKPAENPALEKIQSNPDVQAEKDKLTKNIDALKDDTEKAELKKNMEAFEQRAAKSNMQPSEVAGTYENVNKLIEAKGDTPLTHTERLGLADNIMTQAADPSKIQQGQHETCTVAALENHMYTKNPAEASKMVTDVALTGQYTTKGDPPVTVKVPNQDVQPGEDAVDNERTHASQIFQDTAINIKYAEQNAKTGGHSEFIQTAPSPNGKPPHNGDEVVDNSTKPPKVILQDKTGISSTDIEDVNYQVTGQHEKGMVIQNGSYTDGVGPGTTQVNSEQDLKNTLQQAKDSGHMPVLMRVHTGNEPFYTDSGGGSAGGAGGDSGGWHVVSVTDYDSKTGKAQIENQWGPKSNHPVEVSQLYQSTKNANDISDLPVPGGAGASAHDSGAGAEPKDTAATGTETPTDGAGRVGGALPEAPAKPATATDTGVGATKPGDAPPVTNDLAANKGDTPQELQKPVDNAGDQAAKPGDDDASKKQCEEQKNKLEENLKSKLSDSNPMDKEMHREIDQKIDKFEHRDPPVNAAERAKFYGELNTLMEAKDTKLPHGKDGTDKDARIGLVDQTLENANKPSEIQQGQNQTCGAAAVESQVYTKNPSAAAHMITQVAMTGEYTPQGASSPVKVDPSVLKPDSESKDSLDGSVGAGRNYASQIFEGTAVSLTDGGAGYHEGKANHGGRPPGNHEWVTENGKEVPFKGLTPSDVQSLEFKITGNAGNPVIEKPSHWNEKNGQNTDGGYHVKDEADFKNHLAELKKEGKLPATLMVDSGQPPFKADSGGGKAGGSGGVHYVTVTDVDDQGNVAVTNQWGPEADHSDPNDHSKWIPAGKLYKATTG